MVESLVKQMMRSNESNVDAYKDYSMVAVYLQETSKELRMMLNPVRTLQSYQFTALVCYESPHIRRIFVFLHEVLIIDSIEIFNMPTDTTTSESEDALPGS